MNLTIVQEIIKSRPRTLVLIAVLLLLNIGISAFVAFYQKPQLAELQGKWFQKRRLAAGDTARDMAAIFRQGESDLADWRSRIILKKDFARFIGTLFETASKNSLVLKGVSYRTSQLKGEKLAVYSLDMSVVGNYAAVKRFIADLGRRREIMTIENVSLASSVVDGEAITLKVQLTIYLRLEGQ